MGRKEEQIAIYSRKSKFTGKGESIGNQVELCKEYVEYADIPQGNEEIIRRIGDADCVLVSFTSQIDGSVIEACPALSLRMKDSPAAISKDRTLSG